MKPQFLLLLTLVLCGTTSAQDDAGKKELAQLEGVWQVVSMEEGKQAGADFWKSVKFVFKGNVLTFTGDDALSKKFGKITIVVDPATTPRTIDLKFDAFEKGLLLEGIYEIKGDELKLCIRGEPGANRPLEFATKEGTRLVLFVLKREKS
jgi:uncharacterized protein (TIGR03067 family)